MWRVNVDARGYIGDMVYIMQHKCIIHSFSFGVFFGCNFFQASALFHVSTLDVGIGKFLGGQSIGKVFYWAYGVSCVIHGSGCIIYVSRGQSLLLDIWGTMCNPCDWVHNLCERFKIQNLNNEWI